MKTRERANQKKDSRSFWKNTKRAIVTVVLILLASNAGASDQEARRHPPQLGPGRGLSDDARRGPVCWDYFNSAEHLLLRLRMVQFERTSSYQAFGILDTEEGPYPINGNGELTGEEF